MKKIGIIVGSLRKDSYSGKVAKNLETLLKGKAEVKYIDISKLPVYNQDYDGVIETPAAYDTFRAALASVESIIVVTPEHNRTMPAALKNALDVGSRPYGKNSWKHKTYMVVSQSPGTLSGFGAANEVKMVLSFLNGRVMHQPEVYLANIHTLLYEKGIFVPDTLKFLDSVVSNFVEF